MESDLKTLKEALAGTDLEAIKSATERLVSASRAGQEDLRAAPPVGRAGAGSPATARAAPRAPADEEVVDAEIVDEAGQA